jgi:HlyD family secretion protein
MTLSDLSQLYVVATVDESDIGKVRDPSRPETGDPNEQIVIITADAYPEERFFGRVVMVDTKGVNVNNVVTFGVKIEVTSPNKSKLKPAMTTNVQIITERRDDVLMVPSDLVYRRQGGKRVVPIKGPDGNSQEVEVVAGLTDNVNTEIISGLTEGQELLPPKIEEKKQAQNGILLGRPPGTGGQGAPRPGGGGGGGGGR